MFMPSKSQLTQCEVIKCLKSRIQLHPLCFSSLFKRYICLLALRVLHLLYKVQHRDPVSYACEHLLLVYVCRRFCKTVCPRGYRYIPPYTAYSFRKSLLGTIFFAIRKNCLFVQKNLLFPLEKITFTLEQKKNFYRKNCLIVKKNCLVVKKKLPFNFEKTHILLEKSLLGFMPKLLCLFKKIAFAFRKNYLRLQKKYLFLQKKLPFYLEKNSFFVWKKIVVSSRKNFYF